MKDCNPVHRRSSPLWSIPGSVRSKKRWLKLRLTLITAEIQADIAAQLEAGHEVAYSAIASQEGIALGRLAGGEDEVEGGSLVIDDTGAYGGRFVATKEGFAVEEMAITDEGIEDTFIVGVGEEEDGKEE